MFSVDSLNNRVEVHEGAKVLHERSEPLLSADWTPEEERRAKRKLDMIIMPLLILGFYCLQLDRGN